MKDFFISYTSADKAWAEWIAWLLEDADYSAVIQAWDFRPGANFVLKMQRAAEGSKKTIIVLSNNYLKSPFAQSEWAAAFAGDPEGRKKKLIPIRVEECKPGGLLAPLIYLDIVGLPEQDARLSILGAFSTRAKPARVPAFPGSAQARPHVPFPGDAT